MRADATLAVLAALCLGVACERGEEHALECPSQDRIVRLDDVHYPGADCETAIANAESHLAAAYYRKACEQLAPAAGLPERVSDAWVSGCTPVDGEAAGATLQISVCCP